VVNGIPPVIPEWAYDKHTSEGRRPRPRALPRKLLPARPAAGRQGSVRGRGVRDMGGQERPANLEQLVGRQSASSACCLPHKMWAGLGRLPATGRSLDWAGRWRGGHSVTCHPDDGCRPAAGSYSAAAGNPAPRHRA
jgi:hypothetical protein